MSKHGNVRAATESAGWARSFELPDRHNADSPPEARGLARDEVRLLVAGDQLTHARFRELPRYLRPGDLVVVNNSATTSAAVDATLADLPITLHFATWLDDGGWVVEARTRDRTPLPDRELRGGTVFELAGGARATLREPWLPAARRLWIADVTVDPRVLMSEHGRPITYSYVPRRWSPSYYTTVFGRIPGSAEMASAARPFTQDVVLDLVTSGVSLAPITLHTGVSSPEAGEPPSPERFAVPAATARLVIDTKNAGGRVVAVGTTVTRALESAADEDGRVRPAGGWTDLVLGANRPARVVDGLITGWHAPGASHLDLLVAVAGETTVRRAYAEALDTGYLWHEFGDSALLFRDDGRH
ncbi:S-adenosylmethionine:tRNA ribosyltransferase-isomerase [Nocardia amikacinitolerans]|uniref:S-adenosylmethionine:tRNA ribosyltransferase-isomerase n=1 Tax=Nocardia amikacinitolerans TaxID=756689 RepID=A0A285LU25_9NOCA|nr:S-adenosylmethionine:tRNA ribosyltransferase-isomerase [Nocardia amikacinitolerans]SNY88412.1 S-adenosylmethionine:tRNA ribosyltransferase-isomerase [Nocardia amikacinitolerans]